MNQARTGRPVHGEYDEYYGRYIDRVPEGDLVQILAEQIESTVAPLGGLDDRSAAFAYEPGKWTVAEVVGHMCDVERVMCYRALRIARGDATPLPGFDQDAYVPTAGFGARALGTLVDELVAIRRATVALFTHLPDDAWTRIGTASGAPVSVRALASIIAGHELHHRALLTERYGVRALNA